MTRHIYFDLIITFSGKSSKATTLTIGRRGGCKEREHFIVCGCYATHPRIHQRSVETIAVPKIKTKKLDKLNGKGSVGVSIGMLRTNLKLKKL